MVAVFEEDSGVELSDALLLIREEAEADPRDADEISDVMVLADGVALAVVADEAVLLAKDHPPNPELLLPLVTIDEVFTEAWVEGEAEDDSDNARADDTESIFEADVAVGEEAGLSNTDEEGEADIDAAVEDDSGSGL